MALTLTGIGVWSPALRRHSDREEAADAAAELEQLGYSAIWFPGGDARRRRPLQAAAREDAHLPRLTRRGSASGPAGGPRARGARPQDARAGTRPQPRGAPLPRDAGAHAEGARGRRAGEARRARAGRGARDRSGEGAGPGPAAPRALPAAAE